MIYQRCSEREYPKFHRKLMVHRFPNAHPISLSAIPLPSPVWWPTLTTREYYQLGDCPHIMHNIPRPCLQVFSPLFALLLQYGFYSVCVQNCPIMVGFNLDLLKPCAEICICNLMNVSQGKYPSLSLIIKMVIT